MNEAVKKREIIFVLGKTGYGKSVWARGYSANINRLLVYDPMASWPTVPFYPGADDRLFTAYDLAREHPQNAVKIGVYEPELVPILGNMAFVLENNLMVVEEVSTVFRNTKKLEDWARHLLFIGRHRRCSLILIAQRALSIPIDFRSQATRVVTFNQTEARDHQWLSQYFRNRTDEIGDLPPLTCLDSDARHGVVQRYKIDFSGQATVEEKIQGADGPRRPDTPTELPDSPTELPDSDKSIFPLI